MKNDWLHKMSIVLDKHLENYRLCRILFLIFPVLPR